MRLVFSFRLLAILLLSLSLAACASQMQRTEKAQSLERVEEWLAALDQLNTESLWDQLSPIIQQRHEKAALLKFWSGVREPLGDVISRELQLNWPIEELIGNIPDGNNRKIVYWSSYENRQFIQEQLVVRLDEGEWKLVSWRIR